MLRYLRIAQLGIVALTLTFAGGAHASGESTPVPVEPGQIYLGGAYGQSRLQGPSWKSQIRYKDDSAFTSDGMITVTDPEGYLISHRFDNDRWIPEGFIGYAFGENRYGGSFRLEASGYYFDRKSSATIAGPLTSPTSGFFVDDDSTPPQKPPKMTPAGA